MRNIPGWAVVLLFAGSAAAQQTLPEKHVGQIRAEQPFEVISGSPLCDKVRAADESFVHKRAVDPASLETDLPTLFEKSNEVVLAAFRDQTSAITPSGEDAVEYIDAQVLRSWKGTHKVGDLLTFAIPHAAIPCGSEPGNSRPSMAVLTLTGAGEWEGRPGGPVVLFLRQSRGEETQLTPGLRLAGGDGLQGLFALHTKYVPHGDFESDCRGGMAQAIAKCNAKLNISEETVKIQYRSDPLKKKYEGVRVAIFLLELQALAASSASAAEPRKN